MVEIQLCGKIPSIQAVTQLDALQQRHNVQIRILKDSVPCNPHNPLALQHSIKYGDTTFTIKIKGEPEAIDAVRSAIMDLLMDPTISYEGGNYEMSNQTEDIKDENEFSDLRDLFDNIRVPVSDHRTTPAVSVSADGMIKLHDCASEYFIGNIKDISHHELSRLNTPYFIISNDPFYKPGAKMSNIEEFDFSPTGRIDNRRTIWDNMCNITQGQLYLGQSPINGEFCVSKGGKLFAYTAPGDRYPKLVNERPLPEGAIVTGVSLVYEVHTAIGLLFARCWASPDYWKDPIQIGLCYKDKIAWADMDEERKSLKFDKFVINKDNYRDYLGSRSGSLYFVHVWS